MPKTQIDKMQTERQLIEMRIAVQDHCRLLKSVIAKFEKGEIAQATKKLKTAVDKLYSISLKHAKELGYAEGVTKN